jgi:hypothetical protein
MNRRVLFASMAAAALSPGVTRTMPLIGPRERLSRGFDRTPGSVSSRLGEGKSLSIEHPWAEGCNQRLPALGEELSADRWR